MNLLYLPATVAILAIVLQETDAALKPGDCEGMESLICNVKFSVTHFGLAFPEWVYACINNCVVSKKIYPDVVTSKFFFIQK